jgi:hypothetical protein
VQCQVEEVGAFEVFQQGRLYGVGQVEVVDGGNRDDEVAALERSVFRNQILTDYGKGARVVAVRLVAFPFGPGGSVQCVPVCLRFIVLFTASSRKAADTKANTSRVLRALSVFMVL